MNIHKRHLLKAGVVAAVLAVGGAAVPSAAQADGSVNIYSYRQTDLIQPLLDAFEEKTGIEAKSLFIDKGLEDRIAAEGANSPADVILTVDIGRLVNAEELGITQPVKDAEIEEHSPAQYRDPEG